MCNEVSKEEAENFNGEQSPSPNLIYMIIDFCSHNIRGLHNKVSFVKDFLSVNKISMAALLETHVKREDGLSISSIIAPRFKWLLNDDYHDNGRIWLGWDENIWNVNFVCSSAQHITCNVKRIDGSFSCLISFVYVSNQVYTRKLLWYDLINMQDRLSITEQQRPWCLLGDFNSFLFYFETNRAMSRSHTSTDDFRNCCQSFGVTDLHFSGPIFTK